MWEKTREDGTRKLKLNAVPIIFSFSKPKPTRKAPTKRVMQPVTSSLLSVEDNVKETLEEAPQICCNLEGVLLIINFIILNFVLSF